MGKVARSARSSPARWRSRARRKVIGSSLEAAPVVTSTMRPRRGDRRRRHGRDLDHLVPRRVQGKVPPGAFTLDDVKGVAVVFAKAEDRGLVKCPRSWRYTADVG